MDSHYYETLVMRILKGHYFQKEVSNSHGHKKGRGKHQSYILSNVCA